MKREFLRGLGVEEEHIKKILDEHHDSVREYREKADKVDSLQNELETANNEIKERDNQITQLQEQSGDNEELNKQLEAYKQANADYEQKLKEVQLNNAIKVHFAKDANDPDDVLAFINKENLELQEDGKVKGLEDAGKALKEAKPYLFSENKPTGNAPIDGTSATQNDSITKEQFKNMDYTEQVNLLNTDPDLYRQLSE